MKTKTPVYVVTRQGRRVEPDNYGSRKDAYRRANKLRDQLRQHNDPFTHKVHVHKTDKPWRFR